MVSREKEPHRPGAMGEGRTRKEPQRGGREDVCINTTGIRTPEATANHDTGTVTVHNACIHTVPCIVLYYIYLYGYRSY
jgi:hypothetical protein